MKKKTYYSKEDFEKRYKKWKRKERFVNICYNIFISMIIATLIILIGLLVAILIIK